MKQIAGTKGGSGVWQRIISAMPEHDVYIEAFWGRGTIARLKRPATHTIGLDLDPDAISSGRGLGLMFRADAITWLADYFFGQPGAAATFGGFPFRQHFVYLDPPYLGCSGYYKHELTEEQHRGLCRLFLRLPCPAALSGYRTDVYADELGDTRSTDIPTVNRAGRRVTETVWFNYPEPRRYHDTRFVGLGRRERERIRRRVRNWSAGLKRMPAAERQAVIEACAAASRVIGSADEGT